MISIIIPVYNVEKFLKRCLDSVINQTFTDIEIILVDDGSKDSSGKICDKFKSKDNRIKVIHKENGGMSSARNAGLKICEGDYIFFIDSDDWLADENVIQDFYETALKNDADFVYARINTATDERSYASKYVKKYRDVRLHFLSNPYYLAAWNKLYSKNLKELLLFTEGRVNEDVDIIPIVFSRARKVSLLDRCTYNYYKNQNSITRSNFSEKRFDMFKSVNHAIENFNGTKTETKVFKENLFGFQLFTVYIEILKKTSNVERKEYLINYLKKIREYSFKNFYRTCFMCFVKNESFSKNCKKIPALMYLYIFNHINKRTINND